MATFATPNVTDTGFVGIFQYNNTVTDGAFGLFLLFLVFAGVTVTGLRVSGDFEGSTAVGSLATAFCSVLFLSLGLLTEQVAVGIMVLTAAAGFYLFVSKR